MCNLKMFANKVPDKYSSIDEKLVKIYKIRIKISKITNIWESLPFR